MKKTLDELREWKEKLEHDKKKEKERLKEKVLCVELILPKKEQKEIGVEGFTMKLSELEGFITDNYYDSYVSGVYTFKVFERTNKWIENLPEANF